MPKQMKSGGTNYGGRPEEYEWDAKKYGFGSSGMSSQKELGSYVTPDSAGSGISSRGNEGDFNKGAEMQKTGKEVGKKG